MLTKVCTVHLRRCVHDSKDIRLQFSLRPIVPHPEVGGLCPSDDEGRRAGTPFIRQNFLISFQTQNEYALLPTTFHKLNIVDIMSECLPSWWQAAAEDSSAVGATQDVTALERVSPQVMEALRQGISAYLEQHDDHEVRQLRSHLVLPFHVVMEGVHHVSLSTEPENACIATAATLPFLWQSGAHMNNAWNGKTLIRTDLSEFESASKIRG